MRTREFWQERATKEIWAVELRDGCVVGCFGPIDRDEISPDYLQRYSCRPDGAAEIDALRDHFDLLDEDALLLLAASAD
jgi:hypothetical protein